MEQKILSSRARFAQILSILHKHHIEKGIDPVKFREILEDLGPTFVKIGQIMSTRQDMFSERYCKELMKLRSSVTPMDFDTVQTILNEAYQKSWTEIYESIDMEPLGSASIAQVHFAQLKNGQSVVLKIQRPYIYERMERDVSLLRKAVKVLNLSDIVSSVIDLNMVIDEFWTAAKQEMDFTNEAMFAKRFKRLFKDCNFVYAPKIYDEYTTHQVLVMEYIEGIEISDTEKLDSEGYDRVEIADKLAYNYISQVIEYGFFHADPHSGNLRIRDDKIVWIDFGMMGILERRDRELMKDAVRALALRDTTKLVDTILTLGIVNQEIDYPAFTNEIERFMNQYLNLSFSEMDLGVMVQDVFTICHHYHIALPKGISMLARSMMTIEATLNDLDPSCNMMKIIANHKATLTHVDLGKETKKIASKSIDAFVKGLDLSVQSSDVLKMVQRGQVKVNLNLMGSEQPIAKIDRMINRLIICILIAALLMASSLICTTDMDPKILGIPALGFVGFMSALAMSIWLFFKMLQLHRRNKSF